MRKLFKYFFGGFFLSFLIALIVFRVSYQSKSNLIGGSLLNFGKTRDFSALKYSVGPLMVTDLDCFSLSEGGVTKSQICNEGKDFFYAGILIFNLEVENIRMQIQYKKSLFFSYLVFCLFFVCVLGFFVKFLRDKNFWKKQYFLIAQKFAHDIRSPVATLNLISSKLKDGEMKTIQNEVGNRILKISDDLLRSTRAIEKKRFSFWNNRMFTSASVSKNGNFNIGLRSELEMLRNIENEYRFKQMAIDQSLVFKFELNSASINQGIDPDLESVIYRTVGNCVQNSIEATAKNGQITLGCFFRGRVLCIFVSDNGKGMSPEVLSCLGSMPMSIGKSELKTNSGNGVGIYNSKKDLSNFNAKFEVESEVGIGTKVRILIYQSYSDHEKMSL